MFLLNKNLPQPEIQGSYIRVFTVFCGIDAITDKYLRPMLQHYMNEFPEWLKSKSDFFLEIMCSD